MVEGRKAKRGLNLTSSLIPQVAALVHGALIFAGNHVMQTAVAVHVRVEYVGGHRVVSHVVGHLFELCKSARQVGEGMDVVRRQECCLLDLSSWTMQEMVIFLEMVSRNAILKSPRGQGLFSLIFSSYACCPGPLQRRCKALQGLALGDGLLRGLGHLPQADNILMLLTRIHSRFG